MSANERSMDENTRSMDQNTCSMDQNTCSMDENTCSVGENTQQKLVLLLQNGLRVGGELLGGAFDIQNKRFAAVCTGNIVLLTPASFL